jgi:hypothetical protein
MMPEKNFASARGEKWRRRWEAGVALLLRKRCFYR